MVATLSLLKRPLAYFAAFIITVFLVTGSMRTAVSVIDKQVLPGICSIPLVSRLSLCEGVGPPRSDLARISVASADFPGLARIQDIALDNLLENSSGGAALAVNVKHAELAVKDLVVAVRASNLTIKDVLADALADFATDAHSAGRSLQRLSAKMHVAVDR